MKRFPIFRQGRHTASSGTTLDFGEQALRDAVAAYDPKLAEAPIVVGHPKDNHPAYGWVGSLEYDEQTGEILATPTQLDPAFSEMVQAGRFKKRSASWYLPDSPANPKPGTLYLRHVGFLGAQPPAVKGLRDVSFSEDAGTVEFGQADSWAWSSVAAAFRGFREWMIGDKGIETADKVLPNYLINDLESAAKAAREEAQPAAPVAAFTEDDDMPTVQELQAQLAAQAAEIATLKANQKPADFAERETSLAAREAAVAAAEQAAKRTAVEARIDAAIKAGRVLKGQRAALVDFAMGLPDADSTLDFGEGDKARKVTMREHYLLQIENAPKAVSFGETASEEPPAKAGADFAEAQAKLAAQVANGKA